MPQTDFKCDPRSLRSQASLRGALAEQLRAGEDLSRITVASLTDCAGLTRRTFYSHYKDIPDFIQQVEDAIMDEIRTLVRNIGAATLPELYRNIDELEPAPGAVELLEYLADNRDLIGSLLGPGGDPAFIKRLIDLANETVKEEQGNVLFIDDENGLPESPKTMARIMTVIAFVRPGDLYGQPIDINVPAYGMKLLNLQLDDTDEHNERE